MGWNKSINLKGPQGASGAPGSDANVTSSSISAALGYTPESPANRGVANGYASLDGAGKVPVTQLPSSIMQYQGTYNASTNSPSLVNGTGDTGDVYRVSVAGSRNFGAGSISFQVGDYVIYNGTAWEKSDTTDAVSTVAGLTGDVTASSLRGAIATGTPSSTTYLRGDGTWQTVNATPGGTTADSLGYLGIPPNIQSAAYTLVADDAGKMICHPSTDNNARTFTIPANSSVAYPVGTVVTFVNAVNTLTIGVTSDTLTLAGTTATGSRTLAANGIATIIKIGTTNWIISGIGLA